MQKNCITPLLWAAKSPHATFKKTPIIMKSLFFACLIGSAGLVQATNTYAQTTTVSLHVENQTVGDVLQQIESKTEFSFFYNNRHVDLNRRVSVSMNETNIFKILDAVFDGTDIVYQVVDNRIVLSKRNESLPLVQQSGKKITGTVLDATGMPIIGANVMVKGTTNGTITDLDGKFTLDVEEGATLVVSYIGFANQEIKVGNQTNLSIAMKEDAEALDELVVVGYGTQTKKDLTGAVASVNLENSIINQKPVTNVFQAVKGSVPGLNIGQASTAGGVPSFSVRGTNSISANNSPLVVIDGFVGGSIESVNPLDIESMTVLKDAASAAIYGSQAANGVILITTKRGKSDKPRITGNVNIGIQDWAHLPDMMNGEEYLQFLTDKALAANPNTTALSPKDLLTAKEYEAYSQGHEIDWYKEASQSSIIQNYQLSVDGATDKMNYYFSANYTNQEGVLKGNNYQKIYLRSKINTTITDWLKAGLNISGNFDKRDDRIADMYLAQVQSPYGFIYMRDEGLSDWMDLNPNGTFWNNPLWGLQGEGFYDDVNKGNYLQTNANLDISIPWIQGLSLKLLGTYTLSNRLKASFEHEKALVSAPSQMSDPSVKLANAGGYMETSRSQSYLVNAILNYSKQIGKHFIDASAVFEQKGTNDSYVKFAGYNFSDFGTTVLSYNGLNKAASTQYSGDAYDLLFSPARMQSVLGRINYTFDNRYNATVSVRNDGSSAFAPGHQYATFYAAALGWTVSNESFWKKNDIVNMLKVRLSWGENGNSGINPYSHFAKVSSGGSYIFGTEEGKTLYIGNIPNQELGWERKGEWNLGVDFSLINERVNGSINYYKSVTRDLLVTSKIPIMNGFSSVLENLGKVGNQGVELNLNSVNIQNKDFEWRTDYTFWLNRNKILELNGADLDKDGVPDDDIDNRRFIGEPLGVIYDYVLEGIVQEDDVEYQQKYNRVPGDFKTKDISGPDGVPDGKIDSYDKKIIGYTDPSFTMTLGNTFKYKDFELYFSLYWMCGGKNGFMQANPQGTAPSYFPQAKWLNLDYWTPENPSNEIPRSTMSREDAASQYGCYQSRDFLRLQDVTLSYYLPKTALSKAGLANMKLFVTGTNLLTFTGWRGLDPETGGVIGNYNNPTFKTISFGLNVSF